MALDVKEAVHRAREYARQLFEDEKLENLSLEEIEFDESANHWLITMGYDSSIVVRRKSGPSILPTVEEEPKREYKIFRIDANSGEIVSIKIREVEGVRD